MRLWKPLVCIGYCLCLSRVAVPAELRGQFIFDGFPPFPLPVVDARAAAEFPGQLLVDESLLIDGTSLGIANIVLYVRTENVQITDDARNAASATRIIECKYGQFQPRVSSVWVGNQQLTLVNSDNIRYSPFMTVGVAIKPTPELMPGARVVVPVAVPKSIPQELSGSFRPWMRGYVVMRNNPYVAVSNRDGYFLLEHLPEGVNLEIQIWHERTGYLEATPAWVNGRFTVNLAKDFNLGTVAISPRQFR